MNGTTKAIICACAALSVGADIWTARELESARNAEKQAQKAVMTAIGERDNALELANQYRLQYQSSVKEIAELKETALRLSVPPKGIYDTEFGWDYDYVVRVVGAEARGEPFAGILAVAQCIADTAERTGQTLEQIARGWAYTEPVDRTVLDGMEEVNEACLLVFACGYRPFDKPIEYFYSTRNGGYSAWHESKMFCYEIGKHRFFSGGDANA